MQRDEELLLPMGYTEHSFVAYGPSTCEFDRTGQAEGPVFVLVVIIVVCRE
jgi:hypothetical protein